MKKTFGKILALCLVTLMTLSLFTGCGEKQPPRSEPVEVRNFVIEGNPDVEYITYRVYKIVTCETDPSIQGKFLVSSGNWDKYLDRVKIGQNKCTCEKTEYNMVIMVSQDEENYYATVWDNLGDKLICTEDEVKSHLATKKEVSSEIDWTKIIFADGTSNRVTAHG